MRLSFQSGQLNNISADTLVTFVYQEKPLFNKEIKALDSLFGNGITDIVKAGDFSGKLGDIAVVYPARGTKARRVLIVGLGDNISKENPNGMLERYRRASGIGARRAHALKAKVVAIALPHLGQQMSDGVIAFAEGAALALYKFDKYLSKTKTDKSGIERVLLCSSEKSVSALGAKAVAAASSLIAGTYRARDLANAPGNEIYPDTLAKVAQETGRRSGFKVTVLDEKRITSLGMGGVIGVSKGSARPPRFIILEYKKSAGQPVVLVGKGVTFDTGGISIKPSASMGEMKMDMSGAAAVIGTFEAVAELKLPVNIVGLIPAVENMPSGTAIRPGDILRHYNGKTSEVDNTDAEGRLILADALGYAEKYKPAAVIDLATLTGACVVALGHHATGMMGNDEVLMHKLKSAGEKTFERVWPLPLYDEYEKQIKSDIADVKNVGGRWAGAITAGLFLKKFIGNYKWVHLDIAGTAMLEENSDYALKGGSGVGVRLLAEFLKNWK